jgi:hypothetical protein
MKSTYVIGIALLLLMAVGRSAARGQTPPLEPVEVGSAVTPLTNEISLFRNMEDQGGFRGTTLQIISINQFDIGTDFIIEFTGDFNWNLDLYKNYDYYVELSIVKPVYRSLSVNYQRIYGTFASGPINQFGLRLSLFSGS